MGLPLVIELARAGYKVLGFDILPKVVDGLNAMGIGPRDLITILQAIKAAGAIQADIEVM